MMVRMRIAPFKRTRMVALSSLLCLLVAGCATDQGNQRKPAWAQGGLPGALENYRINNPNVAPGDAAAPDARPDNSFYRPGSGRFVRPTIADAKVVEEGDIKLNFQGANLLEVIKVILGDMLNTTYLVDADVQGTVSMQTAKALSRDALIPTLELLLRMNDAALITDNGVYRVVPLAKAITGARAPQLGDSTLPLPPGYSVRVVPLKFVSANEMAQILEPFVSGANQLVRVDSQRNLLVLAASGGDMDRLLETVRVFDVDRMAGMSVAMFTPDFVDAKTLAEELDKLLADPEQGLMAGLVRFILVERLNGLMVVTPRAEYLARVRDWVKRLDRESGSAGQRLFIYRVQNGKATELAEMMTKLFEPQTQATPAAELAPGVTPATTGQVTPPATGTVQVTPPTPAAVSPAPQANALAADGLSLTNQSKVRVIADEPNNALLILASTSEYRQILSALQQLDVSPLQVLIEVTIAEVTLNDDLQYGVEWFFNNKVGGSLTGVGTLDLGTAGLAGLTPGFSYALQSTGGTVNAVLNLLSTESNLSIISSPSLLVLNNQEANIQVGNEVPVTTQQQQTSDTTATVLNSVEYRNTGVLLKVKPRINSGGLVIMEVEQETSIVPDTDTLTPTIQTRKITSTVAVNSGDTVILGGLIQNNHDLTESGLPVLHTLPVIGNLFGTTSDNQDRTELLVLITPRAITNRTSALQATEEFRRKMHSLVPVHDSATPDDAEQTTPADSTPPSSDQTAPAQRTPLTSIEPLLSPMTCDRIGPFEQRQDADTWLANSPEIEARIEQTTIAAHLGYKVSLAAFENEAAARSALHTLQENGFSDALLYQAGPSRNSISLGVFSKSENADKIASRADALGFDAQVSTLTREQERYWLELKTQTQQALIDARWKENEMANISHVRRKCEAIAAL